MIRSESETSLHKSPLLLVSVRDEQELIQAQLGGADWIDFKEPRRGALAPIDPRTAKSMLALDTFQGKPLSAALGELSEGPSDQAIRLLGLPRIQVVKVGLSGCAERPDWQDQWLSLRRLAARSSKDLAAVIYADWESCGAPRPEEVLEVARRGDCPFVLVDTFDKLGFSTLELLSRNELQQIVKACHSWKCRVALAGRLRTHQLADVLDLGFDLLAVRGAVCAGSRTAAVEASFVERFRARIHRETAAENSFFS